MTGSDSNQKHPSPEKDVAKDVKQDATPNVSWQVGMTQARYQFSQQKSSKGKGFDARKLHRESEHMIRPMGYKNAQRFWIWSFVLGSMAALGSFLLLAGLFFAPDMIPALGQLELERSARVQEIDERIPEQLEAHRQQMAALRERMDALQSYLPEQVTEISNQIGALRGQMEALAETGRLVPLLIQQLEAAKSGAQTPEDAKALQETINSLVGELSSMSTTVAENQSLIQGVMQNLATIDGGQMDIIGLLVNGGQLRQAMMGGEAFAGNLAALDSLTNDPAIQNKIDKLKPYADTGLPTADGFKQQLLDATARIEQQNQSSLQLPLKDQLGGVMDQMVSVRRRGDVQQSLVDSAVPPEFQQAFTSLERGDVFGAAEAVVTVSGPQAALIQPLLQQAESFLAARGVLDDINREVANGIRQAKQGASRMGASGVGGLGGIGALGGAGTGLGGVPSIPPELQNLLQQMTNPQAAPSPADMP